jgi:transcription initiation factor TFIID subunit TAF12
MDPSLEAANQCQNISAVGISTDETEPQQQTAPPTYSEGSLSMTAAAATTAATSSTTTSPKRGDPSIAPLMGTKLQSICHSISSSYTLDAAVQDSLLSMADRFVDKVVSDATKLAKHRGSKTLDVVDVALALKKGYGIEVEGLGSPSAGGAGSKSKIGGWVFGKVERGEGKKKKQRLK